VTGILRPLFFFSLCFLSILALPGEASAQPQRCGSYSMPLGIPCPPFGLQETDPGRPSGWPGAEVQNQYYIDNSVSCTDSLNPFGYPNKPRCTIPIGSRSYPAGSRVEVHGGPYFATTTQFRTSFADCTAAQPCWFIGVGTAGDTTVSLPARLGGAAVGCNRTVLGKAGCVDVGAAQWTIDGNYFVIEGFFSNALERGSIRPTTGTSPHHFALRHLEISGPSKSTGSCTTTGSASNVVIFRNHLHDCGDHVLAQTTENDVHGVQISRSDRVWVVENEIYHNGGDGIQLNAGQTSPDPRSKLSYLGGNHIWENGENALDVKTAEDVIFTSNVLHGYRPSAGSDGTAIVINDENATPTPGDWRLFLFNNTIYDSVVAFRAQSYTNVFGNLMHHISGWCMLAFGGSSETWWENNTCAASGGAFRRFGGSVDTAIRVRNNLFAGLTDPSLMTEVNNAATTDPDTDIRNNLFPSGLVYKWSGGTRINLEAWEDGSQGRADGNLLGVAGFVAAVGNDYRLAAGAPAIDRGTSELTSYNRFLNLYGLRVNYDIHGTERPAAGAWDIGAFEGSAKIGPAPPTNVRIVH
jgi:hypothetical protein